MICTTTQYCAGDKIEKNEISCVCGMYVLREGVYRVLVEKLEGKRSMMRAKDRWGILGWISRKWDVGMWTQLGWIRIGTGGGRLWV